MKDYSYKMVEAEDGTIKVVATPVHNPENAMNLNGDPDYEG